MHLVDMEVLSEEQLLEAAEILTKELPLGWPTFADALGEINDRLVPENTLYAVLVNNIVVGWGGILAPEYNGYVFELHPLVVKKEMQNKGVGKLLVQSLEEAAYAQGGLTIYLGADDEKEDGETSLAQVDLYDDLATQLKQFEAGTHQAGFYFKMGYKIIGVLPDANGRGKPDVFFGKSLSSN